MKEHIKTMNEHLISYEKLFYARIIDIGNSKNKCKCKKKNIHNFQNIGKELLCIECGGYDNILIGY